jgi:hypothetical protein
MQDSERIIALIRTVWSENFYKTYYDLFLTDKRLVLVHKKSKLDSNYGTLLGGVVGGVMGALVGSYVKNARDANEARKQEESEGAPTLDELLEADKKSFAVPYEELEWFRLKLPKWQRCSMEFKAGKKSKEFYLIDERAELLSKILPDIPALYEKIVEENGQSL